MDRARLAAMLALALARRPGRSSVPAAPVVRRRRCGRRVAWPASTLVISEVQTGGASASDEFVEIANQGPAPVDLAGSRSSTRPRPARR